MADSDADRPAVLVEGKRIVQADALAMRLGLEIGMTLATALAIAKELMHFERDIDAEGKRLAWLGLACYRYSSRISVTPPAGLLVEAGGSLQLFGGLQALANELDARFRHLGHAAQIAVAENPAAATALARASNAENPAVQVLRSQDATTALHRVPLACIDLSERQQERLANMGLRRLGQLLALPKQELGKRFDLALVDYLARLSGRKADPREFIEPPEQFRSTFHLAESINAKETLLFPMRRLAAELQEWLAERQFGIDTLTWQFKPLGDEAVYLTVRFAKPIAKQTAFMTLSRLRLERAELPREVMSIALAADSPMPFMASTADLLAKHQAAASRAELVDRLTARLGDEAVQVLANVDDPRPECAWVPMPATASGAEHRRIVAAARFRRDGFRAESAGTSTNEGEIRATASKRRPVWLLDIPKPVAIEDFTLLAGPERIETGWWDAADYRLSRDYFVAASQSGARCWLYRQRNEPGGRDQPSQQSKQKENAGRRNPKWYLHGYFS